MSTLTINYVEGLWYFWFYIAYFSMFLFKWYADFCELTFYFMFMGLRLMVY